MATMHRNSAEGGDATEPSEEAETSVVASHPDLSLNFQRFLEALVRCEGTPPRVRRVEATHCIKHQTDSKVDCNIA